MDDHHSGTGVISDNVEILCHENSFLQFLDCNTDFLSNELPGLIDVFGFIDVQQAGVWSEFLPDLFVDDDIEFASEVLEHVAESVLV